MGARLSAVSVAAAPSDGPALEARPVGVILAGGAATRFGGTPKGLIEVGGVRIIDRIARALGPVVESTVIVANVSDADTWIPGTRTIPDVLKGGGSAAGIHAALSALARPVIIVAWDLPFVTTELFRLLLRHARAATPSAVVLSGASAGEIEPLCAWYAPPCAAAIESEWPTGDRSVLGLLRRVKAVVVPAEEVQTVGSPARLFFNVNTPGDLGEAARLVNAEIGGGPT